MFEAFAHNTLAAKMTVTFKLEVNAYQFNIALRKLCKLISPWCR